MSKPPSPKLRLAAIVSAFFPNSHADVILSRWNTPAQSDEDWGWAGSSDTLICSLYVDQCSKDDISKEYAKLNNVRIVSDIETALTLDTECLAVDGVLLILEHGEYPENEFGQKLYPRKEFFDRIVQVFERCGKSVPVFCDKHLSWNADWAREMVSTAGHMGFPLLAGSSLPYCDLDPPISICPGERVEDALGVFYGGAEVYGFHCMEVLQAALQQRKGGEAGVDSVTAYRGREIGGVLDGSAQSLLSSLLALLPDSFQSIDELTRMEKAEEFVLFCMRHADGFTSHYLMLDGVTRDFLIGIKVHGDPRARVARVCIGGAESFYGHFAKLNSLIERLFLQGESPVSPDRALLTTILISEAMLALHVPGKPRMLAD